MGVGEVVADPLESSSSRLSALWSSALRSSCSTPRTGLGRSLQALSRPGNQSQAAGGPEDAGGDKVATPWGRHLHEHFRFAHARLPRQGHVSGQDIHPDTLRDRVARALSAHGGGQRFSAG